MPTVREEISPPKGYSYRLLKWEQSVDEAELVLSPLRSVRISGYGSRWHYHQAAELIVFLSGEGTRFVGDSIQHFEAGDAVLLGENLPHCWRARGHSSGVCLQWHFPRAHPFWSFAETGPFAHRFELADKGLQFRGRAADRVAAALKQMTEAEGLARLGMLLRTFHVVASVKDDEFKLLSNRALARSVKARHQMAIEAAIRYILANFRNDITLDQVLHESQMSKPTFSREFKGHTGKTLTEFLQRIRLEAACRELTDTTDNIVDIAHSAGFTELSFFNRVFRRAFRCSPTEFRARTVRLAGRKGDHALTRVK
jgi:AraC-like DNA-binding protein/uncharacterized cupin superfamily protein